MGKTADKTAQKAAETVLLEEAELPESAVLPEEPPETAAPEDLIQEGIEAVRRMTEEIQLENEQLERRFAEQRERPVRQGVSRRRYVYVGTLSAALSLVVMGIAMMISLFSPAGIIGAFKIAPVMLVFLGVEIGLAVFLNRGVRLRFSKKSLLVTASLLVITFCMSLISIANTVTGGERGHAEDRLRNMLAQEIRREISPENIRDVEIEILLYGENPAAYNALTDLQDSDVIHLSVQYARVQESAYQFAEDCRKIMDVLEKPPFQSYRFGEVSFAADDGGNRYSLELNWMYQSKLPAAELAPLVGYYGNDVATDIPDLADAE